MTLEIEQVLVLSTQHLSAETVRKLPRPGVQFVSGLAPEYWPSFTREEGWMFQAHDASECALIVEMPRDLACALIFAKERNCAWVMFDRDGPRVAELQVWEW